MPGHVKKSSGPDPDPSKWLFVSFDLKEKLKVFNYWLPSIHFTTVSVRTSRMTRRSPAGFQTNLLGASMKV